MVNNFTLHFNYSEKNIIIDFPKIRKVPEHRVLQNLKSGLKYINKLIFPFKKPDSSIHLQNTYCLPGNSKIRAPDKTYA